MQIKVSGAWKKATPSVKVSGVWKPLQNAFVKVSGVWKSVYASLVEKYARPLQFNPSGSIIRTAFRAETVNTLKSDWSLSYIQRTSSGYNFAGTFNMWVSSEVSPFIVGLRNGHYDLQFTHVATGTVFPLNVSSSQWKISSRRRKVYINQNYPNSTGPLRNLFDFAASHGRQDFTFQVVEK